MKSEDLKIKVLEQSDNTSARTEEPVIIAINDSEFSALANTPSSSKQASEMFSYEAASRGFTSLLNEEVELIPDPKRKGYILIQQAAGGSFSPNAIAAMEKWIKSNNLTPEIHVDKDNKNVAGFSFDTLDILGLYEKFSAGREKEKEHDESVSQQEQEREISVDSILSDFWEGDETKQENISNETPLPFPELVFTTPPSPRRPGPLVNREGSEHSGSDVEERKNELNRQYESREKGVIEDGSLPLSTKKSSAEPQLPNKLLSLETIEEILSGILEGIEGDIKCVPDPKDPNNRIIIEHANKEKPFSRDTLRAIGRLDTGKLLGVMENLAMQGSFDTVGISVKNSDIAIGHLLSELDGTLEKQRGGAERKVEQEVQMQKKRSLTDPLSEEKYEQQIHVVQHSRVSSVPVVSTPTISPSKPYISPTPFEYYKCCDALKAIKEIGGGELKVNPIFKERGRGILRTLNECLKESGQSPINDEKSKTPIPFKAIKDTLDKLNYGYKKEDEVSPREKALKQKKLVHLLNTTRQSVQK
ncbi:MAG: hypothetical protein K0R25_463 [Rickettsiaceae bacterium]|jgi:hypothetical protein|nr:hypothetical protein [Rickettsiaceae bacterium]